MKISDATLGEIYLANHARLDICRSEVTRFKSKTVRASSRRLRYNLGFDLFVPNNSLGAVADKLIAAAKQIGGRAVRLDGI